MAYRMQLIVFSSVFPKCLQQLADLMNDTYRFRGRLHQYGHGEPYDLHMRIMNRFLSDNWLVKLLIKMPSNAIRWMFSPGEPRAADKSGNDRRFSFRTRRTVSDWRMSSGRGYCTDLCGMIL